MVQYTVHPLTKLSQEMQQQTSVKTAMGEQLWRSREPLNIHTLSRLSTWDMIGMAQTLGVYHYGYFTLKGREIQYHGLTTYPSDKIAVLDWGLGAPFTPQDKPPLLLS